MQTNELWLIKKIIYKLFVYKSYILNIYIYKQDLALALNSLQWLICHKNQPN